MRLVAVLAAVIVGGVLVTWSVAAKEGVRAKLDRPVRLGTAPGKTIRVAWRLVDRQGRPFGASGIYLRISRCRGRPLRVPSIARRRGHYSARATVPAGGIRKLLVGLKGWRIIGDRQEHADMFFQFDPPLYRRCT